MKGRTIGDPKERVVKRHLYEGEGGVKEDV